MRRYNIYATVPSVGKYELIKENLCPCGIQEEDYWNECFTWEELKTIIPSLRANGWKVRVEPISEEDCIGKMHIFSFTYGVNHDFKLLRIEALRIIMVRDYGVQKSQKQRLGPFRY
ncbi:MAG TPA: hypothetical protein ENN34_01990 [Deltaproteobacteria bacterium]|nr:hypothetical protein [Deltaproteobacteria bacterium]